MRRIVMAQSNPLIGVGEYRGEEQFSLQTPPGGIVFWPCLVESATFKRKGQSEAQPTGKHEVSLFYTGGHAKVLKDAVDILMDEACKKYNNTETNAFPYKEHEEQDGTEGILFRFKVNTHRKGKDGAPGRPTRIDLYGPDGLPMDAARRDEVVFGSRVQLQCGVYMHCLDKVGVMLQPKVIFVEKFGSVGRPAAASAAEQGFITPDELDNLV
jgi:hypothetical protein